MTTQMAPTTSGAPPTAAASAGSDRRPRARGVVLLVLLLGLAVVGYLVWRGFVAVPPLPESIITLSGRIEGDGSSIAPKIGGRILEVRVREGDSMRAGDIIATLDDQRLQAQEDQARAALLDAESRAQSARDQIAVLREQLQQSALQTDQASLDAAGRVHQAEATLAAAEANVAQQRAAYQVATFNKDAATQLAQTGAISEQQRVQAVAAADQQLAALHAAQLQVDAARAALTTARANLANPGIRRAATAALQRQIVQQEAVVASASAQVARARAQLAEAELNRRDLIVKAPFAGTVLTRVAEPGEIVPAGAPIVTLLNLDQVYLRGFVPEGDIGKVKIGQPAHIYLDSNPHQAIEAQVMRIDPQATFTPQNTYFRQDRVKQVVGVKLLLKGAAGYAKPGMPADGEILVQGSTWPKGHGQ